MNPEALTLAIVGHLVGDYLLQNDWMAMNKKKHFLPCAIHVAIWTTCVCVAAGWTGSWLAGAILSATHFIQDHTNIIRRWMGLVGQEQFATGPCAPWSMIVVDNVWHIVMIAAVWKIIQ